MPTCDVGDLAGGEAQVDRHAPLFLLLEPVGVAAGQALDQRRLAVVDVAGRAERDVDSLHACVSLQGTGSGTSGASRLSAQRGGTTVSPQRIGAGGSRVRITHFASIARPCASIGGRAHWPQASTPRRPTTGSSPSSSVRGSSRTCSLLDPGEDRRLVAAQPRGQLVRANRGRIEPQPAASADSGSAASRCPSARNRRRRGRWPLGAPRRTASAIRSAWPAISARLAAEHPQRGHLAERRSSSRNRRQRRLQGRQRQLVRRGRSGPAGSCARPATRSRTAQDDARPATRRSACRRCGDQVGARRGSTPAASAPGRTRTARNRPATRPPRRRSPAGRGVGDLDQLGQRHLGREAGDLVVARVDPQDGGRVLA